jgi:hypothetical protein
MAARGYDRAVRRNPGTVVVLAGPAPAEVLAAVDRSMNVTLIRPGAAEDGDDPLTTASRALKQAARVSSPYALVPADPLAAVAASWEAMWDVSAPQGPAGFEAAAAQALAAWRSGQFELPDYYLVLAPQALTPPPPPEATPAPSFHLGPLVSARAHRVAVVAAAEPAQQAAGVLHELGSLRHGPWWPPLDELLDVARRFYPDSLAGGPAALASV